MFMKISSGPLPRIDDGFPLSDERSQFMMEVCALFRRVSFLLFSQASTPGSKRKVIEIEEGDEKEDSDVVVIETKKKLKVEEKNNENNKQLSNVGQGAQGTSNLNGKATTTEKDEKKFSLEMANNQADGLVEDIDTLPADRMRTMLVQRSQQLRSLRESICQLLGLLVPEINLPRPEAMPLDDNTIDVLLRDVLDANRETRGGQ